MLEVALDRHRILMLKNKIYIYFFNEIFKNFLTILLTFTAIAWTVRAVNFLDLIIEDGYSSHIYFKYSLLNITTTASRFVPLSFLLALIISITKFERQQEMLILWTTGLSKIKVVNIFFLFSFLVVLFQIVLSMIVNPMSLNKSRSLLRETNFIQVNSILKSNDFSDSFTGITFYIDGKNLEGDLLNIFIKDSSGSLNAMISEIGNSIDTAIYAQRGYVKKNKLFLFDGTIQTLSKKKEIKNIDFERTELNIANFNTRTITQPKIQEISSLNLLLCFNDLNAEKCLVKNNRQIVVENLSKRIGMPLYIPLVSIIASFLLLYKKDKKRNFLKKYIIFIFAFIILIFAEITVRYTGFSNLILGLYFFSPVVLFIILYYLLNKNISAIKNTK